MLTLFLSVLLDLSELDWHNVSVDEALRRLAVAPMTGLEAAQAQRRAAQFGANRISPPPSRTLRKVVGWVFGGFGSLLLAASVVCFIAWYGLSHIPLYSLLSSNKLLKPGSQEASGEPSPASVQPRPCNRPSSRRRPPDGLQCVAGLFDVACHGVYPGHAPR